MKLRLAVACVILCIGCRGREQASTGLLPVTLPDISRMQPSVQQQMRETYAALQKSIDNSGGDAALRGAAYGEVGKLLLAAEHTDAAEPAFLNAQALMPSDGKWPYYLGHVYRSKNDLTRAAALFEKAAQLRPDDEAAVVWLGNVYLDQSKLDGAEAQFSKALAAHPRSPAALFGLGRVALAKQDYRRASEQLEAALAMNPRASVVRYPLALAYRGLGDVQKAEAHLRERGDVNTTLPDPLMQELTRLLQGTQAFELRGDRALDAGDWPGAVAAFREGVTKAPENASLRHKLGTALFLTGDARAAREQFEEAVRLEPDFAIARYSLGVLEASNGRAKEAIVHLTAAVDAQPDYVEARLALADALRGSGRVDDSLRQYDEALRVDPGVAQARFGQAMALVRLGRYRDARDRLAEAAAANPGQPQFSHALARVLAAASDDRVRDGQRAMTIVEALFKQQQSIDLAETTAMALAEVGRFEEAVAMQREAIAAANGSGQPDLARRMAANLARYERRMPCRIPWQDDDPVHHPGPAADAGSSRVTIQ